jgi:Skp family chaperone for outer membrane proteins
MEGDRWQGGLSMRRDPPATVVCWLLAASAAFPLSAQQPAAPPQTPDAVLVAVIDVDYVFEHHAVFQQRLEWIRQQAKGYDAELAQRRREFAQKGEELEKLSPGSPDYRRLEEELARELSALQVQVQLRRKELLSQEAKSYYEAYNDVLRAVADVADRRRISLVLRFDRDNIDPRDRGSVLNGVSRGVVFQRNLDVTQLVLDQIQAASVRLSGLGGQAERPR